MSESLFTTQTPSVTNASDGAPGLTLCTLWTPAVDGLVTGIRWYFPATLPSASPIGLLYSRTSDAAGTELARATFASPTAGTWNSVLFSSAVAVTAGSYYYAAVWTPNRYVASLNFFTSAGLTSGNLSSPQSDNVLPRRNGRFAAGANPAYPTTSSNEPCYFADVLFDVSINGGLAATLPQLTAAMVGSLSIAGQIAASLPGMAAQLGGNVAAGAVARPRGLAVPRPKGLAVPRPPNLGG